MSTTIPPSNIRTFVHTQTTPSITWVVNHNLGSKPLLDIAIVFNGQTIKAMSANLQHQNNNSLIITWTMAYAGTVICASNI